MGKVEEEEEMGKEGEEESEASSSGLSYWVTEEEDAFPASSQGKAPWHLPLDSAKRLLSSGSRRQEGC